jgi:hypothetical protein
MEKVCKNNRQKKFHQKKFKKNFRKISVIFFLAIVVSQPIWGMPAKIWCV